MPNESEMPIRRKTRNRTPPCRPAPAGVYQFLCGAGAEPRIDRAGVRRRRSPFASSTRSDSIRAWARHLRQRFTSAGNRDSRNGRRSALRSRRPPYWRADPVQLMGSSYAVQMSARTSFAITKRMSVLQIVCADGEKWMMFYNLPLPRFDPKYGNVSGLFWVPAYWDWHGHLSPGGNFDAMTESQRFNPPNIAAASSN